MIKEHRLIYLQQSPNVQAGPDEMQELAMQGARTEDPSTILNDVYNRTTAQIDSFFDARRNNLKSLFQKGRKTEMDNTVQDQLQNGIAAAHTDAKLRVSLFTSYTSREYLDLLQDHAEARLHTANLRADLDNLQSMQQASGDAIRLLHTGDWFLKDTRVWLDIRRDRKEAGYGQLEKAKQKDTKKAEKKLGKLETKKTKVEGAIQQKMAKYETKAKKFEDKAKKYIEQRDQANDARLKIEHLERQLRQNPADTSVKKRLERERDKFQKLSETEMQKRDDYLKKTPYYNFYKIWKKTDTEAGGAADLLARADSAAYHEYLRINLGLSEDEATTIIAHLTSPGRSAFLQDERNWKSLIRQNKDFIKFLLTGWYKGHSYTENSGKNIPITAASFEGILKDLHENDDYKNFARLGVRQFEKGMSDFIASPLSTYKQNGLLGLLPYLKDKEAHAAAAATPTTPTAPPTTPPTAPAATAPSSGPTPVSGSVPAPQTPAPQPAPTTPAQGPASTPPPTPSGGPASAPQSTPTTPAGSAPAPTPTAQQTPTGPDAVQPQADSQFKADFDAIRANPKNPDLYLDLAAKLAKGGLHQRAIDILKDAIDEIPNNKEIYTMLGVWHFVLTQYDEAEKAFRKVIELDPDNQDAHFNLGDTLNKLNRKDEADKEYAIAAPEAAVAPSAAVTPEASSENQLGQEFLEVVKKDPTNTTLYLQFIDIAKRTQQLLPAARILRKFAHDATDDNVKIAAYDYLGVALEYLGQRVGAEAAYKKAEKARINVFTNLSAQRFNEQNYKEAAHFMKEAINLDPNNKTLHNSLGHILETMGNLDEAEQAYKEALRIDPNYESAKTRLEALLAKKAQPAPSDALRPEQPEVPAPNKATPDLSDLDTTDPAAVARALGDLMR